MTNNKTDDLQSRVAASIKATKLNFTINEYECTDAVLSNEAAELLSKAAIAEMQKGLPSVLDIDVQITNHLEYDEVENTSWGQPPEIEAAAAAIHDLIKERMGI